MPHKYTWTDDGIEFKYFGVVTHQDIHRAQSIFCNDPRSDTSRYRIIDLRDVMRIKLSETDIEFLGAVCNAQSKTTPNIRSAFIIPENGFDASLYSFKSKMKDSTWSVEIFTDEKVAREWARSGKDFD